MKEILNYVYKISDLRCGQSYTLFAFTVIDNGDKFESFAHYKANDKGIIFQNYL